MEFIIWAALAAFIVNEIMGFDANYKEAVVEFYKSLNTSQVILRVMCGILAWIVIIDAVCKIT